MQSISILYHACSAYPNDPFSSTNTMFVTLILACGKSNGTQHTTNKLAQGPCVADGQLIHELHGRKQVVHIRLVSLFLEFGANPNASFNYPECTFCRLIISIPLKAANGTYAEETYYLLELDCLFDYGADPERKVQLESLSEAARQWCFNQLRIPCYRNLNKHVIREVALRLLRRIEDKTEAEASWTIAKRALPHGVYTHMRSALAGSKRKRD